MNEIPYQHTEQPTEWILPWNLIGSEQKAMDILETNTYDRWYEITDDIKNSGELDAILIGMIREDDTDFDMEQLNACRFYLEVSNEQNIMYTHALQDGCNIWISVEYASKKMLCNTSKRLQSLLVGKITEWHISFGISLSQTQKAFVSNIVNVPLRK